MNQKIAVTSAVVVSSVLAFLFFANRHFSDGISASKQQSEPKTSMNEQWAPVPQDFQVGAGATSARPTQVTGSGSPEETAASSSELSPMELDRQEILNGLSSEMQAMVAQSQTADLEYQQKMMREIEHPGEDRKLPEDQQRLLSVAAAQIPGVNLDSNDAASIVWQPVEDEFALPDDEQFYGAEVDQACADDMCKLQFQGFEGEASRDSAIEKLIADKKIPQGSMVVPDDNNPGRFVVIYPKKQS